MAGSCQDLARNDELCKNSNTSIQTLNLERLCSFHTYEYKEITTVKVSEFIKK